MRSKIGPGILIQYNPFRVGTVVPDDDDQFVFPISTVDFRTRVCSPVAFDIPATSHPEPVSSPITPITSITLIENARYINYINCTHELH